MHNSTEQSKAHRLFFAKATIADRNQEEAVELPIGFARRVMENKAFGIAFVAALLVAVMLALNLA